MCQAFRFSERLGLCKKGSSVRVENHLRAAGLPVDVSRIHNSLPGPRELIDIMRQDKKAQAGKLVFILVRGIGEAFIARDISESDVLAFLTEDMRKT